MAGREIKTERLILRPARLADAEALFGFLGDARAMRHTHVDASPRACRRRIAVHEWHRRRNGYAPWTILAREDGRIIGWGVEIGYFFHPSAWGRGHASELVAVCTGLADQELRLKLISAFAHPDNGASRRVLEKAGFELARFIPGMMRFLYQRSRNKQAT